MRTLIIAAVSILMLACGSGPGSSPITEVAAQQSTPQSEVTPQGNGPVVTEPPPTPVPTPIPAQALVNTHQRACNAVGGVLYLGRQPSSWGGKLDPTYDMCIPSAGRTSTNGNSCGGLSILFTDTGQLDRNALARMREWYSGCFN